MNYEQGRTMICNMALTQLGLEMIENLDQQNDPAKLMKLYYPIVLRRILSEYDWNFARKTLDVTEVTPDIQYKNYDYSFQLPEDFLVARRVRPEQNYWEIYDNDTLVLNTPAQRMINVLDPDDYNVVNEELQYYVELTYTRNDVDAMKMNAGFLQYFAYSLAQETGFMLTGDIGVVQMVLNLSNSYQSIAHVEDSTNTRMREPNERPPWHRNHKDYIEQKYRDGGPNATEEFWNG